MSDEEYQKIVNKVTVYARVSPMDKLKIVKAWKARGEVVAMTGDGVNDAPALKQADIGVAMGISGTDVAKEASDMVLNDDNFATIVKAIERGRWIYDNIKKYLTYLLRCNITEVVVIGGVVLVSGPEYLPLLPAAILYMNLATDGLPALALGVAPPDPDLMQRPPRDPNECGGGDRGARCAARAATGGHAGGSARAAEVSLPGRFQVLPGRPQVVLDVAHNPQAAAVLAANLAASGFAPETIAILGMLADKDIAGVIRAVAPRVARWYLATLGGPRGASARQLADALAACETRAPSSEYDSVAAELAAAQGEAGENDKILVFGSFLTVAEAMAQLQAQRRSGHG